MPFNPEAYIKQKQAEETSGGFDPAAFIAQKKAAQKEGEQEALDPRNYIEDTMSNVQDINKKISDSVNPVLLELVSQINNSVARAVDFLGPDQINAVLQFAGSKMQVPKVTDIPGGGGEHFMPPGAARNIVGAAGEAIPAAIGGGALVRSLAEKAPVIASQADSMLTNVLRSMKGGGVGADAIMGGLSGAGGEAGKETGIPYADLIGSVVTPTAATFIPNAFKQIMAAGAGKLLMGELEKVPSKDAAKLLYDAMLSSGLNPKTTAAKLEGFGADGMPADIGEDFARLLRLSINKVPALKGEARNLFYERNLGQEGRLMPALEKASGTKGMDIDTEISRLEAQTKPQIDKMYKEAADSNLTLSDKLKELMGLQDAPKKAKLVLGSGGKMYWKEPNKKINTKNSLSKARERVQIRLNDKAAAGDKLSIFHEVDASKQELDAQINRALGFGDPKKADFDKARDLVRLKKKMLNEVDLKIPIYKKARNLFAGVESLKNAANAGTLFNRTNARTQSEMFKLYSPSEKEMYILGVKQNVMDTFDSVGMSYDARLRIFGKRGTIKKLRGLLGKDFNDFEEALKREVDFKITSNTAMGNSRTFEQMSDESMLNNAKAVIKKVRTPGGAVDAVADIYSGLQAKKASKEQIKALTEAGYILIDMGLPSGAVQRLLEGANAKAIDRELRRSLRAKLGRESVPAVAGVVLQRTEGKK